MNDTSTFNEAEPKWLQIARMELGEHEVKGGVHNDRIVEYHSFTSLSANEDEVPWCAAFVCWCLAKAGYQHTNSAAAKSYIGYGTASPTWREVGSIVVLSREGGNHVGFLVGHTENTLTLLGGNQGDAVSIKTFPLSRLKDIRWPVKANPKV